MSQTQVPHRIPETMTPHEIGAYMGGLREHFKLTLQDVSEQLHIRVRYVMAIEQGMLEQMPGKVYARGYVHTYAEFLGLDADQVVTQCFGQETGPAPISEVVAKLAIPARGKGTTNWRGLGIAAVVAIAALLVFTQINSSEKETVAPTPAVEPVPEAMLESVRNLVMATPDNLDCLTGDLLLSCFDDSSVTRAMMELENDHRLYYTGPLDLEHAVEAASPSAATTDVTGAGDDGND